MATEKKIKLINPKRLPLTSEKLRELSGLNLSGEQAEEVISALIRFTRVVFDFTVQQEQSTEHKDKTELS